MCDDWQCPYRGHMGQCKLTACIKPQTYTTNKTTQTEPLKICPHCGHLIEYWYEEVNSYAAD